MAAGFEFCANPARAATAIFAKSRAPALPTLRTFDQPP
jgi:hypothetical protein